MTELEQDYLDGMPLKLMIDKHNVSYSWIYTRTKHLPRRLVHRPNVKKVISANEIELICEMYKAGKTQYQIHEELIINQKRVRTILSCYGMLPTNRAFSIVKTPKKAIALYLEKPISLTKFCKQHSICRSSFSRLLVKNKIPMWFKRNYGSTVKKQKIIEMYKLGLPIKEIMRRVKVCKSTVVHHTTGIWRRKPITSKQLTDVLELTNLGYNYKYICDRVGISWSSYYRMIKQHKGTITQARNKRKKNKKDPRLAAMILERLTEGTLFELFRD